MINFTDEDLIKLKQTIGNSAAVEWHKSSKNYYREPYLRVIDKVDETEIGVEAVVPAYWEPHMKLQILEQVCQQMAEARFSYVFSEDLKGN